MKVFTNFLLSALFLFVPFAFSYAQTTPPCGNIIIPESFYGPGSEQEITEIEDCDNPFNEDENVGFSASLSIAGIPVTEGAEIIIPESELPTEVASVMQPSSWGDSFSLFKKDGQDYSLSYWGPPSTTSLESLPSGTYSAVFTYEEPPILNYEHQNYFEKFLAYIIPTAYAYYPSYVQVRVINFTVTREEVVPEPTGASSVLFLPGIQASRLYKDGLFGFEDQLWTPTFNQDVQQLAHTLTGESINDVYTRDVIDEVVGLGTVYKGFLQFLHGLKFLPEPIKDYTAFAYDWRFDVYDIVENGTQYENEIKSAVSEVERLASASHTGKVTIIGHSNGGLVGKALISELERIGKADLIDTFIMVAVPQLGTPKSIGSILHAYDQDLLYGLILNDSTAREVINNMPGAYGLLPAEKYLSSSQEPIIQFDSSFTTSPYKLAFSGNISSFDQYKNFLTGSVGPARSLSDPISTPAKVNETLFTEALENRNKLDNWLAPDGIKVIEVIGTGLPTPKAIEYREILEGENCISVGGQNTCTPNRILKAYALLTKYGDQTVVQRSADAYEGEKEKFFLDLGELRKINREKKYEHYNMMEILQVQILLAKMISSTTPDTIQFISINEITFADEYEVEIIDSPVRIVAEDEEGNISGVVIEEGIKVIKEEIPGSQYFEFADTKYLVTPAETKRTVKLYGEESGNYTLTVAKLGSSDEQELEHQLVNATVTPQMIATYSKDSDGYSTLSTDLNGDGVIDRETTIDGMPIVYTYADLKQAVKDTNLSRAPEKVLLELINAAQEASKRKAKLPILGKLEDLLLKQISQLVKLYTQKRLFIQTEATALEKIIKSISN